MSLTHRIIDLGSERRSGRTTVMLATLSGLQRAGIPSLYLCGSVRMAGYVRTLARHEIRCMAVESFVRCNGLAGVAAIGLDDMGLWSAGVLEEATSIITRMGPATIIRSI